VDGERHWVPRALWSAPVSPLARNLYGLLAGSVSTKKAWTFTHGQLADLLGVKDRRIRQALTELRDAHMVTWKRTALVGPDGDAVPGGAVNSYHPLPPSVWTRASGNRVPVADTRASGNGMPVAPTSKRQQSAGCENAPENAPEKPQKAPGALTHREQAAIDGGATGIERRASGTPVPPPGSKASGSTASGSKTESKATATPCDRPPENAPADRIVRKIPFTDSRSAGPHAIHASVLIDALRADRERAR
jgi:hypothetical protein